MTWAATRTWIAGDPWAGGDANRHLRDDVQNLVDMRRIGHASNQCTSWNTTSTSYVDFGGGSSSTFNVVFVHRQFTPLLIWYAASSYIAASGAGSNWAYFGMAVSLNGGTPAIYDGHSHFQSLLNDHRCISGWINVAGAAPVVPGVYNCWVQLKASASSTTHQTDANDYIVIDAFEANL